MSKYLEVTVEVKNEIETPKGIKIQKVREIYLVDAMSVTEAEARIVKLFQSSGFSQDYEVVSVRSSKVVEIVPAEKKKAEQTKMEQL